MDFKQWPKTKRHEKPLQITVTEKIDGTNACVIFSDTDAADSNTCGTIKTDMGLLCMWCQSRTRFITSENDNANFAKWCEDNATELSQLGPGRHYGEWYGAGIQRNYGLDTKRFALFNTSRWGDSGVCQPPSCCDVVPVLYQGDYLGLEHLHTIWNDLTITGSRLVPGWMKPEGLWIYFHDFDKALKMPLDK